MASPWIFGFSHQAIDTRIALIFGAVTAMYSMFTSYDFGVIRMVPFSIRSDGFAVDFRVFAPGNRYAHCADLRSGHGDVLDVHQLRFRRHPDGAVLDPI